MLFYNNKCFPHGIYGNLKKIKTRMSHDLSFNIFYDKVFNYLCFWLGTPSLLLLHCGFNFGLLFSVLLFSGLLFSVLLFSGLLFSGLLFLV